MTRETGRYETTSTTGEEVRAFVPYPLPPTNPSLRLDAELAELLSRAEERLRLLEVAGDLVPSPEWFIYGFVRKEAVLSAQIEGTQATLMDLFEVEASEWTPATRDVDEVSSYIEALNFAWAEVEAGDGLPISIRLLSETHRLLLTGNRGETKQPGIVRRTQNWIGGTRPGNASFVPPPSHLLAQLLGEMEAYIHSACELPPLIRIGLLHVQFETLHPYLDGNGRLGRLLITLLLRHWGLLTRPMLYLSVYLKEHRAEYYRLLTVVREEGDWEAWIAFFLTGVAEVADQSVGAARQLHAIVEASRTLLHGRSDATVLSLRLFEMLPCNPVLTVTRAVELLGCSRPAAGKTISVLESANVLAPLDDRKMDRVYVFTRYVDVLRQGTEL